MIFSVVLTASLLLFPVVRADAVRGREAGCGCYCGKVISPPCSDRACKRACGWRSGSSSSGGGRSGPFPWGRVTPIEWKKAKRCRGNLFCWVTSGPVVVFAVVLDAPWLIGKGLYYGGRGLGRGAVYVGKGVGKGVKAPGKKFKRWRRKRAYAKRNSVSSSCASVLYKSQEDIRRADREARKFGYTFVKGEFKDAVKELGALSGAELRGLSVWRDGDSDGISDPGEVEPVAALGIERIEARASGLAGDSPMNAAGLSLRDGRVLPTCDWISEDLPPAALTSPSFLDRRTAHKIVLR